MDVVSKDGSTPFMWAVAAQQSEMAEVLIRKGAKVDLSLSPSSQDSPSSKESPSSQDNPSSQDSPSFCLNDRGLVPLQPLHVAARAGAPDMVRLILREGAQVGGRTDGQMDWFPVVLGLLTYTCMVYVAMRTVHIQSCRCHQ